MFATNGDGIRLIERLLIVGMLLIAGVVGASSRAQPSPVPEGKIAFVLANMRGYLISDFQGRVQRRIPLQRGRALIGFPQFNATGTRLWFLSGRGSRYGRKQLWLHVVPASGRSPGRSYRLPVVGTPQSSLRVSTDERRVAVSTWPRNPRDCESFAVLSTYGRLLRQFVAPAGVQLRPEAWSPDSTRLLYTRHSWGINDFCGKFSSSGALLSADRFGLGKPKRLFTLRYGIVGPAVWAPKEHGGFALTAYNQLGDLPSTGKAPLWFFDARGNRRLVARDTFPGPTVGFINTGTSEIVAARAIKGIWAWATAGGKPPRQVVRGGEAEISASSADGERLVISESTRDEWGIYDLRRESFWPFPDALIKQIPPESGTAAYFVR